MTPKLYSLTFSAVEVDILSDLSFDAFGFYLVFLGTIWRTTTTRRSTKITLKVIVLMQMLTILTCAYCITIVWTYHEDQRHQRPSIGQQRTEKTRKKWHGCHGLLILVKTLFTFNDWYPSRSKGVLYHGILVRSHINHALRTCKVANHASICYVRSRVTQIIWV